MRRTNCSYGSYVQVYDFSKFSNLAICSHAKFGNKKLGVFINFKNRFGYSNFCIKIFRGKFCIKNTAQYAYNKIFCCSLSHTASYTYHNGIEFNDMVAGWRDKTKSYI